MACICTHDEDVLNAKTVFFVHAVITILPASFLDISKVMKQQYTTKKRDFSVQNVIMLHLIMVISEILGVDT